MPPELQTAMHRALTLGPDYCPPELFRGSLGAIAAGLKSHAATISDARHSALADTFPRTRSLVGEGLFSEFAERHLQDSNVLSRPLEEIGRGFPALLTGAARSLALLEWAWLESYRAPDYPALSLDSLAGLSAEQIAVLGCALHPATRLVPIGPDSAIRYDGQRITAPFVLVTRPDSDVSVFEAGEQTATLIKLLSCSRSLGELLTADAESASLMVRSGALTTEESGKS